jgi:5-methylcytosine-specific restriction endonuclease McrA
LKCHYCECELIDARNIVSVQSVSWGPPEWKITALMTTGETEIFTAPEDKYPTIDHITPVKFGGKDDLDNLVLSCRKCNSAKAAHLDFVRGNL